MSNANTKRAFDLIICGAGINGLMASYQLISQKDLRVLVLESQYPGHPYGGTYGETRLLRRSYFENGDYIPLVDKSIPLWKKMDEESGHKLLAITDLLLAQYKNNDFLNQLYQQTAPYGVPIDALSRSDAQKKYPFLKMNSHTKLAVEKEVFILKTSSIFTHILTQLKLAPHIELYDQTPVLSLKKEKGKEFVVMTSQGTYSAPKILVTVGGWMNSFFPELDLPITLYESPQFWFKEKPNTPRITTPFLLSAGEGDQIVYGFPDYGSGVKLASYLLGPMLKNPSERNLESDFSLSFIQNVIKEKFSYLDPHPIRKHNCFLDLGLSDHILLRHHPEHSDIVLWGAGSGHGYKMTPHYAQLALDMIFNNRST